MYNAIKLELLLNHILIALYFVLLLLFSSVSIIKIIFDIAVKYNNINHFLKKCASFLFYYNFNLSF